MLKNAVVILALFLLAACQTFKNVAEYREKEREKCACVREACKPCPGQFTK